MKKERKVYEVPKLKVTPLRMRARMMAASNVQKQGYGEAIDLDDSNSGGGNSRSFSFE